MKFYSFHLFSTTLLTKCILTLTNATDMNATHTYTQREGGQRQKQTDRNIGH